MKKSSKILSLFLAIVMAVTCAGFSTTAFAADQSQCATITFDGVENNSCIDDALYAINNARAQHGMSQLTLDATLTEQAKQRAKDIIVAYDSEDICLPSGDAVSAYFPTMISTLLYRFSNVPSNEYLTNALSYDAVAYYNQYAQSVGIGFFTAGGVTTMYVVFSYAPATAGYQNFVDANVRASVYTQINNITLRYQDDIDTKYPCYVCSTIAYFTNGCATSFVKISNDQVTYRSSNSSVAKYKSGKVYPKKNGKYTMTVTLNSNPAVSNSYAYTVSGLSKPKVTVKSLKSSKKKSATVKWLNNISDASGYEIQYSTSKKFTKKTTKTVTVKGRSKTSKTLTKLKSKKTYYVRVRAYVNQGNGEKIYGSWSKTKSVKIK
ncbi:MAG: fibronectin type III domain-containing protein [Eubacterium sp.]